MDIGISSLRHDMANLLNTVYPESVVGKWLEFTEGAGIDSSAPTPVQIKQVNNFLKSKLVAVPNSDKIYFWLLEDLDNQDDFMLLFKNYWMEELVNITDEFRLV